MSNFGFNLLATVQGSIATQEYQWHEWTDSTTNAHGYEVDTYAAPVTRRGSVQPMSREQVQSEGLEQSKTYIRIYDTELINLMSRSRNADKITYNGGDYKAMPTSDDWQASGGWGAVLAVRVDNA